MVLHDASRCPGNRVDFTLPRRLTHRRVSLLLADDREVLDNRGVGGKEGVELGDGLVDLRVAGALQLLGGVDVVVEVVSAEDAGRWVVVDVAWFGDSGGPAPSSCGTTSPRCWTDRAWTSSGSAVMDSAEPAVTTWVMA